MLALPVERLVGNSNTAGSSSGTKDTPSRNSLSPDSIVSESSLSTTSSSGESQTDTSYSPRNSNNNCKMHVIMKKSGETQTDNRMMMMISPQNNATSLRRTDDESIKHNHSQHRRNIIINNNNEDEHDKRRSLTPEHKGEALNPTVVVKSEVDMEMIERDAMEQMRNSKRSLPSMTMGEDEYGLDGGRKKLIMLSRGGERIQSANRISSMNNIHDNGKQRVNNNNYNNAEDERTAKETCTKSFTSGDHLRHSNNRVLAAPAGSDDDEEDEINIEVDDDEDNGDNNRDADNNRRNNNVKGGRKEEQEERIMEGSSITIIGNAHNNYNYQQRPPSRPLSTSSSLSTASSQSNNFKPSNHLHHHYFHSHLHPHFSPGNCSTTSNGGGSSGGQSSLLKFSIEDILRPDFGLSLSPTTSNSTKRPSIFNPFLISPNANSSSSSVINHKLHNHHHHSPSSSSSKPRNGSVSSTDGHRPYRPSSVNCHSEDSNGSCKSRTREEVVDDSKVNPPVPKGPLLWPAWVYCTRYSDRPSSGKSNIRVQYDII
jgi:hypothetical protein